MDNKTLFNAVEAELRNARMALNNAAAYMDTIRTVVDTVVVNELGERFIPLWDDLEDESIVYGVKIEDIDEELKTTLNRIRGDKIKHIKYNTKLEEALLPI